MAEHNTSSTSLPPGTAATGLILAGGAANRMQPAGHGIDKGLLLLGGWPLVVWQIRQLALQTQAQLISANRNAAQYRRFGCPVITDRYPGLPGPLAGIHAALSQIETDWLAVCPCDTPFLPAGWVNTLRQAALGEERPIAYACAEGQPHPLVALIHRRTLPAFAQALQQGQHRVRQLYQAQQAIAVSFADADAFFNINTPDGWQHAQHIVTAMPSSPLPPNARLASLEAGLADFDPAAVPLEQARALLARYVPTPVGTESIPLAEGLGRVLATTVSAPFDLPAHDNSAMDGYAFRHACLQADGPTTLPVGGRTLAGEAPATALPAGSAWRVMTGAALPAGADTVVPQEEVDILETAAGSSMPRLIRIAGRPRAGQHVRRQGEDLRHGEAALPAGRRLMPADLGVAASLGLQQLQVFRRLRVGCLSTGSELKQAGEAAAAGQIYDSNRQTLLAMLQMQGCQALDLGSVPDQPEALQQALCSASAQVDAILTTGGAAGGDADLIRQVAAAQGEAHGWLLRMRPGRPLVVGRIGQAVLFGLPGNPVAALLSYLFVIGDALRQMAGASPCPLPRIRAQAADAFGKRPGRTEFQRVRLARQADGTTLASSVGSQSSAMLRTMADADGIAVLPEAAGPVAPGDWLEVIPMHSILGS